MKIEIYIFDQIKSIILEKTAEYLLLGGIET